ncbi:cyclic peptide export ABC transporter [Marinicrinis sediminis]|uniref:Cyclic peptide export ABC transporter n=1 Tax=Marinicrinis sediminis TaxID=1652465 RepID=A0ABW5RA78_9BACL
MTKRIGARLFRYGITIALMLMLTLPPFHVYSSENSDKKASDRVREMDAWLEEQLANSGIPGASVVMVQGEETVYQRGFGYRDKEKEEPVTAETLFELASASKAFTGLAILQLAQQGRLDLQAPVQTYLPWFEMVYHGERNGQSLEGPVPVTIEQALYQTTGIPFSSIGDIPQGDGEEALENTVRTLVGTELDFYPGERHFYATINYDILGLVIENVSGMDYESYMKEEVLKPMGLDQTYLLHEEAEQTHQLATGYKYGFLQSLPYEAPIYRGNTPGGYVRSNAHDMARWLKIQLGAVPFDQELLARSQAPNRKVPPAAEGYSYAAGWRVYQSGGGEWSHGGNNPTFSSFVGFRPEEQFGVAILANMNSSYTAQIGQGLLDMWQGQTPAKLDGDLYQTVDKVSVAMLSMTVPFLLITLWLWGRLLVDLARRKRRWNGKTGRFWITAVGTAGFLSVVAYGLYQIPDVFFWGLPWRFVQVWAADSLILALIILMVSVALFSLYVLLSSFLQRQREQGWFALLILSIISGLGNATIIFIVNETLNRQGHFEAGLLLFFAIGILLYVLGQKIVRTRLIHMTTNLIYDKRMELINKLLKTPYQQFERLKSGHIQAALNNDTETISQFAKTAITGGTGLITLMCCFIYLGVINLQGLLISLAVILSTAGLYFVMGRLASKAWEKARDTQNVFFKLIHDLMHGFKELRLHTGKKEAFARDVQDSCEHYRQKRIQGEMNFIHVFVIGELLFTFVIGTVAFLFPILFTEMKNETLRSYIFVFLYMTGPLHGVLHAIPHLFQMRISWNRIQQFTKEISALSAAREPAFVEHSSSRQLQVSLHDVTFEYVGREEETDMAKTREPESDSERNVDPPAKRFTVGPLNVDFHAGEIVFITGGNGSGKSTMAKLITGLYEPKEGSITLNGLPVSSEELGQQYAAIFSDVYLFDKLYGIEVEPQRDRMTQHLRRLRLSEKVAIEEGGFSTTKLSTGQRKRLALLISYMEDRPIYLFDEWAADQDPEFRRFFYHQLLPELKEKGKCVIAITHDDAYFHLADRLIKMEMGAMTEMTELTAYHQIETASK